jgi:Tol biopolymer transport system component
MTAFDRFDPFERRITEAIDEIAAARLPDYLDDIFRQTARSSQRPRWTFLERWLPVDTALAPSGLARRLPLRPLVFLAILALLAMAAFYVGTSRSRVPLPFGPAGNGILAYTYANDLYVRDSLTGTGRVLIGGDGSQGQPSFSPNGEWLAYVTSGSGPDQFMVAKIDGSGSRLLTTIPATGNAQAAWRPDSQAIAFVYDHGGFPKLSLVGVDGSGGDAIDLHGWTPWDVAWQPPTGSRLLVRVQGSGERMDLATLKADGSDLKAFGLNRTSPFGPQYTLSGPTWSPDGRTIAYNSVDTVTGPDGQPYSHFRVRQIGADGANERPTTGPSDVQVQEAWPVYSPDGRWIVVQHWVFASDSKVETYQWLAVMPADGSGPARDIGPKIPGGENANLAKIWSPDGTRILALADNTHQVFSIDPTTGAYERLEFTNGDFDWQRVALP